MIVRNSIKKIAIIGASYLQMPLIERAKEMGLETHVFAWEEGAVGKKSADYFYPISVVEKELILKKCQDIRVNGVCSIASDVAVTTVCYVAENMGLVANSIESSRYCTNKFLMRKKLLLGGAPSPRFVLVDSVRNRENLKLDLPLIVKPTDRSGSRGVRKINSFSELEEAIEHAIEASFEKKAIVEEYIEGKEYSVECISWKGEHQLLAVTEKYTTGEPHFIEIGHVEPSSIGQSDIDRIQKVVFDALSILKIEFGASHSEVKVLEDKVVIIEIGARMGGDFIGSDLVQLSTNYDFVGNIIRCSMGEKPEKFIESEGKCAAIRYILDANDIKIWEKVVEKYPEILVKSELPNSINTVKDSSSRNGYYILQTINRDKMPIDLVMNGEA